MSDRTPTREEESEARRLALVQALAKGRISKEHYFLADALEVVQREPRERFSWYEKGMRCKAAGDLKGAAEWLERSVRPPSIYKGHYRELFKIYRQWNREAAKAGRWQEVIDRVLTMAELDDEMVTALAARAAQFDDGPKRLISQFDGNRNLTITDAKQLVKAATASGQLELAAKAQELVRVVEARR